MPTIRHRLERLEARAGHLPQHGPASVQVYIPDNGRGDGPREFRAGPARVIVYEPRLDRESEP